MGILNRFFAKLMGSQPKDGDNPSHSTPPPKSDNHGNDAVKKDTGKYEDPRPASEYGGDNEKAYKERQRKRDEEDRRRRNNNDDTHNANLVTASIIMSDSEPSRSPGSSYSSDSGSSSSFSSGGGGGD